MVNELRKKILLIDDDPLVLKSFTRLLEREGYDVIPTTSYQEALHAIEQKTFDLVLSDIRMPGKNGVETASEIQSKLTESSKEDVPIIFITGYAEMSDRLQAEHLGEVVLKPFDVERLVMTIREYL